MTCAPLLTTCGEKYNCNLLLRYTNGRVMDLYIELQLIRAIPQRYNCKSLFVPQDLLGKLKIFSIPE